MSSEQTFVLSFIWQISISYYSLKDLIHLNNKKAKKKKIPMSIGFNAFSKKITIWPFMVKQCFWLPILHYSYNLKLNVYNVYT